METVFHEAFWHFRTKPFRRDEETIDLVAFYYQLSSGANFCPLFDQSVKKAVSYRPMEIGISFVSLLFFLRACRLKKKTQSKNTVRVTSFQANSTNARGRSGRMEIQTT